MQGSARTPDNTREGASFEVVAVDAAAESDEIERYAGGRIKSRTNARTGTVTVHADSEAGEVLKVLHRDGSQTDFDAAGNRVYSYEAASGRESWYHPGTDVPRYARQNGTQYFYDVQGWLAKRTGVDGSRAEYDSDGKTTRSYDPYTDLQVSYHTGTEAVRWTRQSGVERSYDLSGGLTRMDDRDGSWTEYTAGLPVRRYEVSTGTEYSYHAGTDKVRFLRRTGEELYFSDKGALSRRIDKNGDKTEYASDGRVSYRYEHALGRETWYHAGVDNAVKFTRQDHTDLYYDISGAFIRRAGGGSASRNDLAKDGKKAYTFNALTGMETYYHAGTDTVRLTRQNGVERAYDTSGRLIRVLEVGGSRTDYGAGGNKTHHYEASTDTKTLFHSGTDRVWTIRTNGINRFYDRSGALTRETDASGRTDYGADGFRTFRYAPSTGMEIWYHEGTDAVKFTRLNGAYRFYDPAGWLTHRQERGGSWVNYDASGRVVHQYDSVTDRETWYTAGTDAARLVRHAGRSQTYDVFGRLIVEAEDASTFRRIDPDTKDITSYQGGAMVSFFQFSTGTTTVFHSGTDRVKSLSTRNGVTRHFDPDGNLIRQDEPSGDHTLFAAGDPPKRIFAFEAATGKRTEWDAASGYRKRIVHRTGRVELFENDRLFKEIFPNGDYRLFRPDGSMEERAGDSDRRVRERFIDSDPYGSAGYDYDAKNRKTKTVYKGGSYIITTYKDDPALSGSVLNTESFFDANDKMLRVLVYNSKGNQVRGMVTEDNRNLDCFLDECWKEDMGFDESWSSLKGGARIAVIEAGSVDSSHARAVAGIVRRAAGQDPEIGVFTAPDHLQIVEVLKTAARQGYKVINLSLEFLKEGILKWGRSLGYEADGATREFKKILQEGVNYARQLGAIVVAASGNQGADFSVLAELDGVISVGSTDYLDRRLGSSGFGRALDFVASGHQVSSEGKLWTGTSFATPMISAMIAGLVSVRNGSSAVNEDRILGAMRGASSDLGTSGWDQFFGWGKAHAGRTLRALISNIS